MSSDPRPRLAPVNPATGEPKRPVVLWIAAACFALAVACLGVALVVIYFTSIYFFDKASWFQKLFVTQPGSLERVLLIVAVTGLALVPSIACVIAGFYAWAGYRWARWAAVIAFVLTGTAVLLHYPALPAIALGLAGAVLVWLPASGRFFAAWTLRRHPTARYADPVTEVVYGPLPRYR